MAKRPRMIIAPSKLAELLAAMTAGQLIFSLRTLLQMLVHCKMLTVGRRPNCCALRCRAWGEWLLGCAIETDLTSYCVLYMHFRRWYLEFVTSHAVVTGGTFRRVRLSRWFQPLPPVCPVCPSPRQIAAWSRTALHEIF